MDVAFEFDFARTRTLEVFQRELEASPRQPILLRRCGHIGCANDEIRPKRIELRKGQAVIAEKKPVDLV
jgi:hypothetical protein